MGCAQKIKIIDKIQLWHTQNGKFQNQEEINAERTIKQRRLL